LQEYSAKYDLRGLNIKIGMSAMNCYDQYNMNAKEKIMYIVKAAGAIFLAGMIFYRSIIIAVILCPLAFIYPSIRKKEIIRKRKAELNIQFKDMLYSLSSSLSVSKSIEMAVKDTIKDLEIIYPDPNAYINQEIRWIIRGMELNQPIEELFLDFAKRSGIEDIYNFSEVFSLCNRAGGNLVEIIKNTSGIISDKIETRQEIDVMLAERKFEQKVLSVFPALIVLLLSLNAEEYIRPVFETMIGRIIMTISLILCLAATYISKKIIDIKV
jgi:tight adherence protein B